MNNQSYEPAKGLAQSVTHRRALKTFGLGLAGLALICIKFSAKAGPGDARAELAPTNMPAPIPWSQLGAKAEADYKGDGLLVVPTVAGARLRCVFQGLEGEATREGLWLTSAITNSQQDRFRLMAAAVGRHSSSSSSTFEKTGDVILEGQTVRFIRLGLTEEYTVSMDGVRQDFLVLEQPAGTGDLEVRLNVNGAAIEPTTSGVQLVLQNSGRKIAYGQLRAIDATGKELTARMEIFSARDDTSGVCPASGAASACTNAPETRTRVRTSRLAAPEDGRTPVPTLLVLVNDTNAVYPIRIDPTFSDANWISMGGIPGANGEVRAAAVDASGNFYVGGQFTIVGDVFATNIAKWNGSGWSALGSGMHPGPYGGYGPVYALAVSGSDLYAGGDFTIPGANSATNIAKWDGNTWSPLGSGLPASNGNPYVFALAVSGGDLYAGGHFDSAGGIPANYVAKWNGSGWKALGSGVSYDVLALAVSGSDIYVGGDFTTAGGSTAHQIAKWNGSTWSALGSGMDGPVNALAVSGSTLYAGGYFTMAGGTAANNIAKWNGSSWSPLGSGLAGDYYGHPQVYALAVSGSNVCAGGYFTNADGSAANCIAKWNGSSWSALDSGMGFPDPYVYPYVYALAVSGSNVYAGGIFITAGKAGATYIAEWKGNSWSALGSGLNGSVEALAVSGSNLYAGGDFTTAGGATGVAKWNGSSWSALGSGIPITGPGSPVSALATSGSDLFVGGSFTNAGGIVASNIAKWNGSSWSALGSGIDRDVYALAVSGSNLYAGGYFTAAGSVPANSIARWDGNTWSPLGSGLPVVNALAVSGSDLYAGGSFITADGATNIAKWDGSTWSPLGDGTDGAVGALAVSGSNLYAGGYFTMAGSVPANSIARWDGSNWSALGSGMDNGVSALAVSGSDLYIAGSFTNAGGVDIGFGIARWDGSNWSWLGSGMGPPNANIPPSVRALAVSGSDLYAGGDFLAAGGKMSSYIARAYLLPLPTLSVSRSGANVMVSWPSADTSGFALEQTSPLASPSTWLPTAALIADDGTNKSVTIPATNNAQFFRLRRP